MLAVLLPIVNLCNQNYILCEIRSENVSQPGEICLPGGHSLDGESITETAVRETIEELSIPEEYIHMTDTIISETMTSGNTVHAAVAQIDRQALASIVRDEAEVEGWFLLPINWLRNHPAKEYAYNKPELMPQGLLKYLENYPDILEGTTLCWNYEGRIVWGLTARIINSFISKL